MRLSLAAVIASAVCLVACARPKPETSSITVFAAASTIDVLREAGRRFEKATGIEVVFSFDSSSNLARQIKVGSPADVYISADEKWMDDVAAAGAIRKETRADLFANDLVLIAPATVPKFEVQMTGNFDFNVSLPQIKRIAVGDPEHVPAGRYAKQSLASLGWWDAVKPLLISAQDVRAALRLVEMDEADAGIVYSTDAMASDKVVVIARFPDDSHDPIRYPIAQCSDLAEAARFIEFLRSAEMVAVFEQAGFRMVAAVSGTGG